LVELARIWAYHLLRPDSPVLQTVNGEPMEQVWLRAMGWLLPPLLVAALPLAFYRLSRDRAIIAGFALPVSLFLLLKPTGAERFLLPSAAALSTLVADEITSRRVVVNALVAGALLAVTIMLFVGVQQRTDYEQGTLTDTARFPFCPELPWYPDAVAKVRDRVDRTRRPVLAALSQAPQSTWQAAAWIFLLREAEPAAQVVAIDGIHHFHLQEYERFAGALPRTTIVLYHSPPGGPSWPTAATYDRRDMVHTPEQWAQLEQRRPLYEEAIVPAGSDFRPFAGFPIGYPFPQGTVNFHARLNGAP